MDQRVTRAPWFAHHASVNAMFRQHVVGTLLGRPTSVKRCALATATSGIHKWEEGMGLRLSVACSCYGSTKEEEWSR